MVFFVYGNFYFSLSRKYTTFLKWLLISMQFKYPHLILVKMLEVSKRRALKLKIYLSYIQLDKVFEYVQLTKIFQSGYIPGFFASICTEFFRFNTTLTSSKEMTLQIMLK